LRTEASASTVSTSAPYFSFAFAYAGCTDLRNGSRAGRATFAPFAVMSASCRSSFARISLRIQSATSRPALVTASRSAGESFCQVFSDTDSGIGL
jgi:hypothetical protein